MTSDSLVLELIHPVTQDAAVPGCWLPKAQLKL